MNYKINAFNCPECQKIGKDSPSEPLLTSLTKDEYFVTCICPEGHKINVYTTVMRYGYLYDLALNSYIENNFQESFLYLYSSLELFWRDFTAAYLVSIKGYDPEPVSTLMGKTDKLKTSERRYGAFISTYCSFFNSIYGLDDIVITVESFKKINDLRSKRNNVVHNGELVDENEIKNFLWLVYDCIKTIEKNFIMPSELTTLKLTVFENFLLINQRYYNDKIDISSVNSGISTMVGSFNQLDFRASSDFEELVKDYKTMRKWFEF